MRILFFSILLLAFSISSFSQGFKWNEEIDKEFRSKTVKVDLSKTRSFLPSSYSLAKYIPFVHNQGTTGMCVSYALANCRTIIYAKNKRIYSSDDIIINSFSPFFNYYQTKSSSDYRCDQGLNPVLAIHNIVKYGIAKLSDVEYPEYWPFTEKQLCTYYPPSYQNDLARAYKYRIDEANTFNTGVSNNDKIKALKNALASGKPIFFGMNPFPKSLQNSWGKDFWQPDSYSNEKTSIGHAMTVIAYDDYKYGGSFQILNSYGKNWGNSGKIWIRYNDLIKYTPVFVVLGRRYEDSTFGAPISNEISDVGSSIGEEIDPEYINVDEIPPLADFIKN